jgi:hypothetical protein
MTRVPLIAVLLGACAATAQAASLDVTAHYRMKAAAYSNLGFNSSARNDHSFIANDARLGLAVKRIPLESRGGEETTLDVALLLRGIGVSGSSATYAAPFDRIASYYPSADMTPFVENAYLRVHKLWALPWEATFGRQSYRLGSGLLLDDDGAGLTGVSARGELPWWGLKLEGFAFHDRNPLVSAPSSLDLFGLSLDLPSEGTWQLNQLVERDRGNQIVYGCAYAGNPTTGGCQVSKAVRSFTSVRYQISHGALVFEGEAAMQKGVATPTGPNPAPNHITYSGNAQTVRMKWKQSLYKSGQGIARVSVARGTGDDPGTPTTDEAFYPSRGHRHNGIERVGYGDFFAATPYDALGATTTVSGLGNNASGLLVVGAGYTPPAWRGFTLDIDYFLYQAERVKSGPRTLGMEWDFRLRYPIRDQFNIALSAAYFRAGKALDAGRGVSRKYALEASGRF